MKQLIKCLRPEKKNVIHTCDFFSENCIGKIVAIKGVKLFTMNKIFIRQFVYI